MDKEKQLAEQLIKTLIGIGVPILVNGVTGERKAAIFSAALLVVQKFSKYVQVYFLGNETQTTKARGMMLLAVARLLTQCNIAKIEWRSYIMKFGSEAAGQFFGEIAGNYAAKLAGNSGNIQASRGSVSSIP